MKYARKDSTVEAFRIGIDPVPDWFMNKVTDNTAVLYKDDMGRTYARFTIGTYSETVPYGEYIVKYSDWQISGQSVEYFKEYYVELPEDKPVNEAEPVDPEKERFEALDEHYTSLARETKLAYDCFIKAGFHPNDAFTLLIKLMENPIKSPKRSKEDVIREFNKWRAERKERLENEMADRVPTSH
jgi:hypothetical protein